jgi:hypothetical protein
MRNAYKISVGKLEGKRSFEGPRHRWEDDSIMDLREDVDWIHLAPEWDWWQALGNTAVSLQVS